MAFEIIDPGDFLSREFFTEADFLESVDNYNWDRFIDKKVLVRGCKSNIIPPWAYMIISSRLMPFVKSIRFGNEHDNIVVYKK